MAHFAELDENNNVIRVIVVDNSELLDDTGAEVEAKGIEFCAKLLGGNWVQTSINNKIRYRFAHPGMVYNKDLDVFTQPQPKPWFVLNDSYEWVCPVGINPANGKVLEDWQWEWLDKVFSINIDWGMNIG